jgi:hypothetical protein
MAIEWPDSLQSDVQQARINDCGAVATGHSQSCDWSNERLADDRLQGTAAID